MTNLNNLLGELYGNMIVGISSVTVPTLRGGRRNPQKGRVSKWNHGSTGQVFPNNKSNGYENKVNRGLQKEGKGEFQVGPRQWGRRIEGTPFVEHKGNHYLEIIFLNGGTSVYTLDGRPIPQSQVQGLPVPREGNQGGLTDKVIIRTYSLESIRTLKIGGKVYHGPFVIE